MKNKIGTSKSIKKMQEGGDSTKVYRKEAEAAGNKLMKADVRDFGKNVKSFAEKQKQLKKSENKGKPGYTSEGESNFKKIFGFKKGGSVKAKPSVMKKGGTVKSKNK